MDRPSPTRHREPVRSGTGPRCKSGSSSGSINEPGSEAGLGSLEATERGAPGGADRRNDRGRDTAQSELAL